MTNTHLIGRKVCTVALIGAGLLFSSEHLSQQTGPAIALPAAEYQVQITGSIKTPAAPRH